MRISLLLFLVALATAGVAAPKTVAPNTAAVLDQESFKHYVDSFNSMVPEEVVNAIPDASAWEWMKTNIPFFACPDKGVEEVYYYRWWTFRKHIKKTPAGFILTEFLKPVKHATEYNAVSSAFGHHVAEGRWLHDPQYLNEYMSFWLRSGKNGGLQPRFHQFSGWAAAAAYDRWLVSGNRGFLISMLDPLLLDYRTWEQDRQLESGLFWQSDVADGMEQSVSGGRKVKNVRPSINSYMYGDAKAIAAIATFDGKPSLAREYETKAAKLKTLVQNQLWSRTDDFFETQLASGDLAPVREQVGFTPWYFDLPDHGRGYERAWKQLMDSKGFYAPYGPTTVEQRNPGFLIADKGDDCQWNGPSWPFATTVTLKALANVLNDYHQDAITKTDYFKIFQVYTQSQHIMLDDGRVIPWIDENLNPFTGEWQARSMKIRKGIFYGRGDHYNHSSYADLVISGVVGLRPRADNIVEVNPLLPDGMWDWFCLDNVLYHGRTLTIIWDKSGSKFGKGKGLLVFADGRQVAHAEHLTRVTGRLPEL
jgi:hypothetical protein